MDDNIYNSSFESGALNSNIDLGDYPSQRSYDDIFKKPFFSNLYFYIKNKQYEVVTMWSLIIVTIIVFISLVIKNDKDEAETEFSM